MCVLLIIDWTNVLKSYSIGFFSSSVPRICNGAGAGMLQLIKYVNLSVKPARICLHKTLSTLRDVIYSTYYR